MKYSRLLLLIAIGTTYSYTASASDAAGNNSAKSRSVNATTQGTVGNTIHHYEYVMPDGFICVYDIDKWCSWLRG